MEVQTKDKNRSIWNWQSTA